MGYRYVLSLGSEIDNKGGTYVEGIFGPTSYLPFLSNDDQSIFYQNLLFNSCTQVQMTEFGPMFINQVCEVKTNDNQTFTVQIQPGFVRSDGTPVTIDDIYFSYGSIIISNARSIPALNSYSDIVIEKTSDTTLRLIFPKKSIDNKLFFQYHIIPRHVLSDKSFDFYKTEFGQYPIYTKCAQIRPQSTDLNSLVFNLSNCNNTKLGFYQIKNTISFDTLQQDYAITNRSIIDAYQYGEGLDGYIAKPIVTHAYTTIFFNTNSEKMRIRLRRSLAGLINHHFYSGNYEKFIRKDQRIFNNFMSTGDNITEFLTRVTPDGSISIAELQESGVKALTGKSISFEETTRRNAYYITAKTSIDINIKTSNSYDSIGIMYGESDKGNIVSYNKTQKTAKHTIMNSEVKPGLNTYTLYTKDKEKVINIGSISIYLTDTEDSNKSIGNPNTTLTIIYQNTIPTQKVVQHLRTIFEQMRIAEFFMFIPLQTKTEIEEEILKNNYDIAIVPIQRGLKKDISPILKTDDPIINPSQYTNPQFTNLFEQYIQFDEDNKAIRDQLIAIYTRDIPFMILGKQIDTIFVKPDIYEKVFLTYTGTLFENTRRELIYSNLSRARSMHIDTENIGGPAAFWQYIQKTLFPGRHVEQDDNKIESLDETIE